MTGVFYFRNGIGNLVQMTPALQAVASMCGGSIDACLDSGWNDSRRDAVVCMLRAMPFVGEVFSYPKEKLPANYDLWYFTAHSEPSDAYRLFETRSKRAMPRVGWERLYTREIDYYMDGARRLGYTGPRPPVYMPITDGQVLSKREGITVALCNGSFGKMGKVKRWPYFAELSNVLRKYYDARVVLVGNGDELAGVSGENFVGKTDILHTARILTECDALVTVDTGLMHVADALDVPMVSIWGGTIASKNGPISAKARIVRSCIPCQPCQYTPKFDTCERPECLNSLTVGEVMRNVRTLIH